MIKIEIMDRMAQLTKAEVIKSNNLLGKVLGVNTIHNLRRLFNTGIINKYIRHERELHHLDPFNVDIESKIYGTEDENTSLLIIIRKYGKPFIHLTIHVAPDTLKTGNKEKGVIHISKDVYKTSRRGHLNHLFYAIYYLEKVENYAIQEEDNKQENTVVYEVNNITDSAQKIPYITESKPPPKNQSEPITFSIGYGYSTPIYDGAPQDYIADVKRYDDEVKQEMDVITSVLNKLFDRRNKETYIGDHKNAYEINNSLMGVLNNINKRQKYISRKNKGMMLNRSGKTMIHRRQKQKTKKRNIPKV